MNTEEWLQHAAKRLDQAGIGTARLDAIILLEHVTGIDRSRLLAEPELELSTDNLSKLNNLLTQRTRHVPMAYLRGRTEFYGREFLITPAVLEPRPESETMIEELTKLPDLPSKPLIADLGTGSGALGITAAMELPDASVELIDIDPEALEVAKTNVDKFTLPIKTFVSNLLELADIAYDVLLCNLPYVPDDYQINTAASHEPSIAIFGGRDGLDLYRRLFKQLRGRPIKPLYILTESFPFQHRSLSDMASHNQYELATENDFIVVFRRAQ